MPFYVKRVFNDRYNPKNLVELFALLVALFSCFFDTTEAFEECDKHG
jgi:hypothetical protein